MKPPIPIIMSPGPDVRGPFEIVPIPPHAQGSKGRDVKVQALLEVLPDAVVIANQLGEMVLLNAQTEKLFGYKRQELLNRPIEILIPERFRSQHRVDWNEFVAQPGLRAIGDGLELCGLQKDGSEFPAEISLSALETDEGVLVFSTIRDISARRRTEEDLRRLASIVESSDEAIIGKTKEGIITSWNASAEQLYGYSAREAVGKHVSMLVAADRPEDISETMERLQRGETVNHFETIRVRKDGKKIHIAVTTSPIRDAMERLVGASTISRDISVRKDAEKHLAQMEGRYRGLLEAAPDAMVVVNRDGEIVLLNLQAEKQFGYRRDELVGQKVKRIIPEGFAERLIADGTRTAAEALAQQIGTGIELYGRRKDGSDFPIEIMLSPLENAEGILVTAAIRDISVRKKSEQHLVKTVGELKRSNDELQQFAYVASHDLQEPLRMVASYTQLLAKRYHGRLDSDADEFIAYAVDGSNRMQGLIQDLLAYSRVGTTGKVLHEISSEHALKEALTNLRATIEESGAVVTHNSLPAITTDDTQLAQVFQNLVGNAIKYRSAEVPHVHVSATRNSGNEWIFSVKDNGLGIDPQYFERIFILFQRLHGPTEFKGTGIGLAICKKILEGLGGRIWVESQPDKGSTFYFALPERNGKS
ncbi:MAG TPA: PAS domain S-box protein [Candidatus Dormibacteraeota bacterium]|nr:PAS domain S-box protein [Candidatus Dormibacteraeota bacterium]